MSETFYHIDRWDDFVPGQTLGLDRLDEWGPEINSLVGELYPGGVSHHGHHYFTQDLHDGESDDLWDFSCEVIFEAARIARFPDRPSRFQSIFGFETLGDAHTFVDEVVDSGYTVWEVTADRFFKADMNLVDASDYARGLHRARYYWRGETFLDDPLWEVLLVPPVEVVRAVDDETGDGDRDGGAGAHR